MGWRIRHFSPAHILTDLADDGIAEHDGMWPVYDRQWLELELTGMLYEDVECSYFSHDPPFLTESVQKNFNLTDTKN